MAVTISAISPRDVSAILPLYGEVHELHRQSEPGEIPPFELDAARTLLAELIDRPGVFCLLARSDGIDAGYVLFHIIRREASAAVTAKRFAFIDQLGVTERLRRQGIGHVLLEEVRARLRQELVSEMQASHFGFNEASRAFFDKEGFRYLSAGRAGLVDVPSEQSGFTKTGKRL